ncbi:class I SAM-dependent methyltransferase [Mycobacterium sp. DL592]|uniref:class I SAM-dependent methyltransferase n=1 Tax=Mycobacterium sp. DL592 TaxID=2675524 RepID=UPI0014242D26|nr:class I SAM-dependent methyltransferase [Mycobacterium sp. DL592]
MSANSQVPIYETSDHYLGQLGEDYLAYAAVIMDTTGKITAEIMQPYVNSTDTVLDFGAGTGSTLHHLKARRKVAVEINPAARQGCHDRFGNEIEMHSDISSIGNGSVDVCISNHCLEHVPYPIAALREIRRTLRPGGRLILRVPIDDWRASKQYRAEDINHHLHTWTPLLLGHTLFDAGFREFSVRVDAHAVPPRHTEKFYRLLPRPLFNAVCRMIAILRRRRSLVAVCTA